MRAIGVRSSVRHAGHQLALGLARAGDPFGHVVECARHLADIVVAMNAGARRHLCGAERLAAGATSCSGRRLRRMHAEQPQARGCAGA
jgi:hypothetical protein